MKKLYTALHSGKKLLCVCYAAFLLISLLWSAGTLAYDRGLRSSGELRPLRLSVESFELYNMEAAGEGVFVSLSDDPRMVLTDCPLHVSRIDIKIDFINMDPGEFTLFYKPRPGMEDFDANFRLWGQLQPDGSYSFTLPLGECYGLRIDPGMYAGLQMDFVDIIMNETQPVSTFFAPTNSWFAAFIIFPALAASAIQYVIACADAFFARRGNTSKEGK